jgi:hypothetical protein
MVIATMESVQVVLQAITKGFSRAMNQATESVRRLGKASKTALIDPHAKIDKNFRSLRTTSSRLSDSFREMAGRLGKFRMEFLSVLFLGMFIQRTFSNLLRTSLEWTGVTEIMTEALGLLFLPIAETVLGWALMFLSAVTALSDEQKKLIGWVVLLGAAFGGLLFLVGTLALGIGGLVMAFGWIALPVTLAAAAIAAFVAIIAGGAILDPLIGKTEDLNVVMNGLDFGKIKEKLSEGITKALNYLSEKLPEWTEKGLELAQTVIDAIKENWDDISDTMKTLIGAFNTWIKENSVTLGEIGWDIGTAILVGMVDAYMEFFAGFGQWVRGEFDKAINNTGSAKRLGVSSGTGSPSMKPFSISDVIHRQSGGPIKPNVPYMVGEAGPELFVSDQAGDIVPSGGFGDGIVINYTINANGNSTREIEALIKENNNKLVSDLRRLSKG